MTHFVGVGAGASALVGGGTGVENGFVDGLGEGLSFLVGVWTGSEPSPFPEGVSFEPFLVGDVGWSYLVGDWTGLQSGLGGVSFPVGVPSGW